MSGRSAGHSSTYCTIVENHNRSTFSREKVSGRHAGDTCADNANIGSDVFT
jgi:hypothetical protein